MEALTAIAAVLAAAGAIFNSWQIAKLTGRVDGLEMGVSSLRSDIAGVRDRVSRIEGCLDGWQDQRHPSPTK